MRQQHQEGSFEVLIPSDPQEAPRVQDLIEVRLKSFTTKTGDFSIKLALEEALVNAIKHGNQMDPDKQVLVAYRVLADRFEIRITDEATASTPRTCPTRPAVENLERPCGRGLMLMRHYMTEVEYHGQGNAVPMAKVPQRLAQQPDVASASTVNQS